MAQRIEWDPHQEQRRELWLAIATNPSMVYEVADLALAAFDSKFGAPGSNEVEVKVVMGDELHTSATQHTNGHTGSKTGL